MGGGREESVGRGTLFGILTQATTATFTAVLTLVLVRKLGADGYGLLALGLSLVAIAGLVADLGIAPSAARYLADRRGDPDGLRAVAATALWLKLGPTLAVAGLLAALAGPIAAAYGKPGLEAPLRVLAVSVVAEAFFLQWTHTFVALRRLRLNATMVLVESVFEASASLAFVLLGGGVTGAALGRATGYTVGVLFGALLVARLVGARRGRRTRTDPQLRRQIRAYALPLFVTNGAYIAYTSIDTQLIAVLLSSTAVGVWAAPLRLLTLLGYISLAVATAISPRMSLQTPGGPDVRAFNAGLRWLVILHAAIAVVVVVWAEPIVHLILGEEFGRSTDVLRGMGVLVILLGVSPLASTTANYLGQATRRIPIVLASLAVNAAVDLVLLPTIGVMGAVIGTTVAYAIYVTAHMRICRQVVEIPLRPLAVTIARSAAAALAAAAVLAALGTSDLRVIDWVVGLIGGATVFAAVLVLTGEVGADELDAAGRRLRTVRAR